MNTDLPPYLSEKPIVAVLNEKCIVRPAEKAKNGEVFTPLYLICDLLEKFPLEVWQNPNLKWLDPANGLGHICIVVYYRLMEGLKEVNGFKNTKKRSKHIIEQMLCMVELNPECVEMSKTLFKTIDKDATPTILCADFLNDYTKSDKFDIILGNPPYNSDGIKHKGKKNIYVSFVIKGLELLKPDGYMAYIHPPTYRIPHHKIQHARINLNAIYTSKRILCIRMFSIPATKKMMNVMMNVDYILIQNRSEQNPAFLSTLIDINAKEYKQHIAPNDFLPNYGLPLLQKMRAKALQNGSIKLILTSEMHAQIIKKAQATAAGQVKAQKIKKEKNYKNIHGIKSKGIKICWSTEPHSFLTKRKLIINGIGSYNYVFYDERGEYGFTQSPIAIIDPSPNTLQLVQSKLFHYLVNATKIIGNNFNIQTALFLPLISAEEIAIHNAEDLYDYFEFSAEERKEIELCAIPKYKTNELEEDD